jgi:hypothetical protein
VSVRETTYDFFHTSYYIVRAHENQKILPLQGLPTILNSNSRDRTPGFPDRSEVQNRIKDGHHGHNDERASGSLVMAADSPIAFFFKQKGHMARFYK